MRDDLLIPASLPPPAVDPDEARRQARRILGDGRYQPEGRSPLERVENWIGDLLGNLALPGAPGGGPSRLGVLLVLAAVVVLAWLGWRFLRAMPWRTRRPRRRRPDVEVAPGDAPPESRDVLLALALAAEADGRWADAVRYRFRALVLGLARRRVLPEHPSATTGELRRAVEQADDEIRTGFVRAAERFESIRYGGVPAGPDDATEIAEWDRRLVGDGTR